MKFIPTQYLALSSVLLLSACAVGPDYQRPDSELPATFKEVQGWKQAQPSDAVPRGKWWEAYGDTVLNQLMEQVDISNQNIKVAEAQYRQAQALVQAARASLFPTLGVSVSNTRSLAPVNALSVNPGNINTSNNFGLNASWEPDLWGGIRRNVESNDASATASAGDLEAARLSARAALAQSYFQLRIADMQKRMYDDTVIAYTKSLELTQNQYKAGVANQVAVAQAQTLLNSTLALAIDISVTRAQLEHAIALLIGQSASSFSLAPQTLVTDPATGLVSGPLSELVANLPAVPLGLPSELLERRPDIAAAERRMAAANARIGVAKAAFFPTLTLSGSAGYQSSEWSGLVSSPNSFWSFGPSLALSLFDGGARRAASAQAVAGFDQSVASYRQTVLSAMQGVEDNLVALRLLEEETRAQQAAVKYARDAVTMTINQYKAGIVSYLNVVTVQATALTNERTLMNLYNRRLSAHVALLTALGGDWRISRQSK